MKNVIEPSYVPYRATKESAGYDITLPRDYILTAGKWVEIDTGIRFEDSDKCVGTWHFVGMIYPRSSLGFKYGLRFANTTCVIDQDYRDNIKLMVTVDKDVILVKGDRIAQMIFTPYLTLENEKKPTQERCGGIGSTGKKINIEEY